MKRVVMCLLCFLPMILFAQVKVAILETVDKEGVVSYAYKLMLRSNLAKAITNSAGYEAYDRTDMDAILSEQNFQRTGLVSEDQIRRLGEMTGAKYILVAEAAKVDDKNMFITAKIVDVETAKTEATDNMLMHTTPEDIQHGSEELAGKLLGLGLESTRKSNHVSRKINGDVVTFEDGTKGVIFYKTNDGHGLVVSLISATAKWEDVKRTRDCRDIRMLRNEKGKEELTVGKGKENSDCIIRELGHVHAPAVAWCVQLGEDWYLPSAGELWYLLAEANDKKDEKGNISAILMRAGGMPLTDSMYWSSTEYEAEEAVCAKSNGSLSTEDKDQELIVRAVRTF